MTTTKKLVWRLKESPTTEKIVLLMNTGILTKEEAREVLLNQETEEDRDLESLKSEIKFLRELVEKLSNRSQIVTTIREIEVPIYRGYPWWGPYATWCSGTTYTGSAGTNLSLSATNTTTSQASSFSDIKTF